MEFPFILKQESLPASRVYSDRAAGAHDSIVALRARSYILRMHSSLSLVIWYKSSSQFYNIVNVNYTFSKLLNLFLTSNEKGN